MAPAVPLWGSFSSGMSPVTSGKWWRWTLLSQSFQSWIQAQIRYTHLSENQVNESEGNSMPTGWRDHCFSSWASPNWKEGWYGTERNIWQGCPGKAGMYNLVRLEGPSLKMTSDNERHLLVRFYQCDCFCTVAIVRIDWITHAFRPTLSDSITISKHLLPDI